MVICKYYSTDIISAEKEFVSKRDFVAEIQANGKAERFVELGFSFGCNQNCSHEFGICLDVVLVTKRKLLPI